MNAREFDDAVYAALEEGLGVQLVFESRDFEPPAERNRFADRVYAEGHDGTYLLELRGTELEISPLNFSWDRPWRGVQIADPIAALRWFELPHDPTELRELLAPHIERAREIWLAGRIACRDCSELVPPYHANRCGDEAICHQCLEEKHGVVF